LGQLGQHNTQGDPEEDTPDANDEGPIDPQADHFGCARPALGDQSALNPDGSVQNNRGSICAFEWKYFETSLLKRLRNMPEKVLTLWLEVATFLNTGLCHSIEYKGGGRTQNFKVSVTWYLAHTQLFFRTKPKIIFYCSGHKTSFQATSRPCWTIGIETIEPRYQHPSHSRHQQKSRLRTPQDLKCGTGLIEGHGRSALVSLCDFEKIHQKIPWKTRLRPLGPIN
jgi:hypothetical protein